MRAFFRDRQLGAGENMAVLEQAGISVEQVEEMHRYLAIANYEDRFVIPTTHREEAENAYALRGNCGFSFGNGCDAGEPKPSLFGGKMGRRKMIPIRMLDD
jgi:nitrate reductase beta subunit